MKKLTWIALIVMLLVFTIGLAQPIHYAKQVTIAWDEVTEYESGDPVEPELSISYMVYLKHRDTDVISTVAEVDVPTITFSYDRGVYIAGVSSIVNYPDGTKEENPDITWSDSTDTVRVPIPFFVAFTEVAKYVTGLITID